MRKATVLWRLLEAIPLAVFNAVFFVAVGVENPESVWISYGFINFAYAMLLATRILVPDGKSAAVFGWSLHAVSTAYLLIELIVGIAFIVLAATNCQVALLTQLVIAGLYGLVLISTMIANRQTAEAEERRSSQIEYVKNASAELRGLLDRIGDSKAKKRVEKVYDAIYTSPVKSQPDVAELESQILQSIHSLIDAADDDQMTHLADSLLIAVNERNRRLKLLNVSR